jgi:hypothetical protein
MPRKARHSKGYRADGDGAGAQVVLRKGDGAGVREGLFVSSKTHEGTFAKRLRMMRM